MDARRIVVEEEVTDKSEATDKNLGRLDKFITHHTPDLSRTKVQSLIRQGLVSLNGEPVNNLSEPIKQGDIIEFEVVPEPLPTVEATDIPLNVIYEDKYLAIINKPAGLTVHPGAGNYSHTVVNALLFRYQGELSSVSGPTRLGIVHRLDKNTSGLLIIAKTDQTHMLLGALLEAHEIKRTYHALIWGCFAPIHGTIETNIGRSMRDRKKMAVVPTGGKHAITHYKTLTVFQRKAVTLVECSLETGRTHQIRVHMSHLGHPIVGDPEYSTNRTRERKWMSTEAFKYVQGIERQMLHAKKLSFIHPMTNELLELEIDLPDDMAKLIEELAD